MSAHFTPSPFRHFQTRRDLILVGNDTIRLHLDTRPRLKITFRAVYTPLTDRVNRGEEIYAENSSFEHRLGLWVKKLNLDTHKSVFASINVNVRYCPTPEPQKRRPEQPDVEDVSEERTATS